MEFNLSQKFLILKTEFSFSSYNNNKNPPSINLEGIIVIIYLLSVFVTRTTNEFSNNRVTWNPFIR